MTNELANTLTSLLSVALSVVALYRTRKVDQISIRQGEIAASLAARELELIEREEKQRHQADLRVELTNRGEWAFVIVNQGNGTARELKFSLLDCQVQPFIDYDQFPLSLKPNARVKVSASIHSGCPEHYKVLLEWSEDDGAKRSEEFKVSM